MDLQQQARREVTANLSMWSAEEATAAAAEIQRLSQNSLAAKLRIGEILLEAKERLPHGHYLLWLEQEIGYSQQHASRHTLLARNHTCVSGLPQDASWKQIQAVLPREIKAPPPARQVTYQPMYLDMGTDLARWYCWHEGWDLDEAREAAAESLAGTERFVTTVLGSVDSPSRFTCSGSDYRSLGTMEDDLRLARQRVAILEAADYSDTLEGIIQRWYKSEYEPPK